MKDDEKSDLVERTTVFGLRVSRDSYDVGWYGAVWCVGGGCFRASFMELKMVKNTTEKGFKKPQIIRRALELV